jgi:Ohr subfamily peroxiredoxin
LAVKLSSPGTPGTGTNPEQLFAAGWSACFLSSIRLAAGKMKLRLPADATIDAEVDLGTTDGGYGLAARLDVSLPGIDRKTAQALVDAAHDICTYSRATRGNVDVTIAVV